MESQPQASTAAPPLLTATELASQGTPQAWLSLPYGLRSKSRLRARLEDGRELALLLPRGTVLRGGDVLCCQDGTLVGVRAAPEPVSTARAPQPVPQPAPQPAPQPGPNALRFRRACYHLGNRHVALQIGPDFLRYLHDHVLDEMCRSLGLEMSRELAPFEPEGGAYGGAPHVEGQHDSGHGSHYPHGGGPPDHPH